MTPKKGEYIGISSEDILWSYLSCSARRKANFLSELEGVSVLFDVSGASAGRSVSRDGAFVSALVIGPADDVSCVELCDWFFG